MNAVSQKHHSVGQLFFSLMSHNLYDVGLYRFVTQRIWRCPRSCLMDNYVENISDNHLEIGVGSGFFLEHTLCSDFVRRLVLLDLNKRCLIKSAKRLKFFTPQTRHHNILEPLESEEYKFSSAGMNYVLHCIPGGFWRNRRIFGHVQSQLEKGGVFFGATLIKQPMHTGIWSWSFMKLLNAFGIFNNTHQTVAELRRALEASFSEVEISMVGNAAVFKAIK